jgi:hypothetical protein
MRYVLAFLCFIPLPVLATGLDWDCGDRYWNSCSVQTRFGEAKCRVGILDRAVKGTFGGELIYQSRSPNNRNELHFAVNECKAAIERRYWQIR